MGVGHSPSNEQINGVQGVGGIPMPGNYFHTRNQSQDVGSLSTSKKPLKNQIVQRKRAAIGNTNQQEGAGEHMFNEDNDQQYR
jgi:hypothetical protein